jgi:cellulose synthase/poly-beta-1,6-N-acetylglucosamine synthase-like glycosyltransferase
MTVGGLHSAGSRDLDRAAVELHRAAQSAGLAALVALSQVGPGPEKAALKHTRPAGRPTSRPDGRPVSPTRGDHLAPRAARSGVRGARPVSTQPPGGRYRPLTEQAPNRTHRQQRSRHGNRLRQLSRPRELTRVVMAPAMTLLQRTQYAVLAVAWLLCSAYFWLWWMQPANAGNRVLFIVVSVALFYSVTLLPSFYLFYLGQMRRPLPMDARRAQQAGVVGRVAVISLTVPGAESLDIVRRQLAAMKAIRYPHDSWILVDKEHSPEIQYLAARMGVRYFCRHDESVWGPAGVARWNAPAPPFQAKTKAGNVNSWLDRYGDFYTHFTQLDIDHHPVPSYLERVLGFFVDPKVAWVQAPSVYGNHEYWTARGSSEQEVVLQGPLQMGFFGFCRTPFIIGSHCTYDTKAIQRIGGFQPTRAEDHLDTVCLAAEGYEGVYLPEVIATGDGPETFGTYLAQQFAWAFSMIQVLFRYTPKLIRRYTPRQGLQFLFAQTWYTFWSLSMLIVFMSPLFSLALNSPISHVTFWNFFVHTLPASVTATVVWWWSRSWHQPKRVSLSWRGVVLHMARWVIVLSAFVQVILRVKKPYMITVKGLGADVRQTFKMGLVAPYVGLFAVSIGACWVYLVRYSYSASQGYLFFGLEDAALFLLLIMVIFLLDARELVLAEVPVLQCVRLRLAPLLLTATMVAALMTTAAASYTRILEALSGGASWPFH